MPVTGRSGTTDSVAASVMKPEPVTPLAPLDVSIATSRIVAFLRERQVDVERLRDEQHRQRHVDVGAVEVERVAGGHDQADDRLRAAERSILAISCGSAASDELVPSTISSSSLM
jgi:hypothetical protein